MKHKYQMLYNLRILLILMLVGGNVYMQDPESYYESGEKQLAAGALVKAESLFQQALQMDPSYAPALVKLAQVYLQKGDMVQTQTYLRQAIDIDPENQEYRDEYERLNEINTLMAQGIRSMNSGLYDDAYESYRVVNEKFPFFAEAVYSMGLARFRQKNFDEAVHHFHQTLELNPLHENARAAVRNVAKNTFNEGNNAYRRGDLEGALEAYKKVLETDDTFYQANYQIGVIQAKMGNLSVALESYTKALDINPNFYKGWFALGLAHVKSGNLDAALDAYAKTVEVNPGYAKAYKSMGDIYLERKEIDKAIDAYKTAIQVDDKYEPATFSLGVVYIDQEKYTEAITYLIKATELNPKDYMAWYHLAHAYNAIGECEKAVKAARKCTDLKKNFGGGWLELGISEYCGGKGNKTAAINSLERARNDRTWRKMAEYEQDKIKNPEKYQD